MLFRSVEQRRGHVRGDEIEALAHVQEGGRPEDRRVAQPVRDRADVQREALLVVRAAAAEVLGYLWGVCQERT